MITSFKNKETELVFNGYAVPSFPKEIWERAYLKLRMLHSSTSVQDLQIPPSNHLEKLKGNRKGQHSIRINQKWRICFIWIDGNAENVEIVDYH